MRKKIQIKGLRGAIYKRGEDSYRVQLSLGRNAAGKYDVKRETVRGVEQDAIDLLTRWNVEYLDNVIMPSNHQTVEQAYLEWIDDVKHYNKTNTYKFYCNMFEWYILPAERNTKLKDLTLMKMQAILKKHPGSDAHIKSALSSLCSWCVTNHKLVKNECDKLKTAYRVKEKTEDDIWDLDQVKKVYSVLTFKNLYDIFIVLGVELGLRPQEILGLEWDQVKHDRVIVNQAVNDRDPKQFELGETKNKRTRVLYMTDYLAEKLDEHRRRQTERIANNTKYENNNLVVADTNGKVPCLAYIGKYRATVAKRAGVHRIPPSHLRSTHLSILNDLGIPLGTLQALAGHADPATTSRHYVKTYSATAKAAIDTLHQHLHE